MILTRGHRYILPLLGVVNPLLATQIPLNTLSCIQLSPYEQHLEGNCIFFVRAPPPGPLRRGVVPLTGYPPSSQGFLSPPWARTWDHELRYPFEVVPTINWASSSVGSGNYLEWVSKLMVPGSSPRRRKKPL